METTDRHPAIQRLLNRPECSSAFELLGSALPGSDATSLLLEAMTARASGLTAADVLSQYRRDRFVAPASIDPIVMAKLRLSALETLSDGFTPIETSPLAPLGTHSAISGVSQNNVVTTVRMTEVAADPTNQLALEAAVRRRELLDLDAKSTEQVRLCAADRVVRAQVFEGKRSFAHFALLGAVVAGRSTAGHRFEVDSLTNMLLRLAAFVSEVVDGGITIRLSDFDGRFDSVVSEVSGVVSEVTEAVSSDRVTCITDDDRESGRGYYQNICFNFSIDTGTERVEIGDGGFVAWTDALLQSRKERLLIGGISLERLGLLMTEVDGPATPGQVSEV